MIVTAPFVLSGKDCKESIDHVLLFSPNDLPVSPFIEVLP
jgi:hypothetical protein